MSSNENKKKMNIEPEKNNKNEIYVDIRMNVRNVAW